MNKKVMTKNTTTSMVSFTLSTIIIVIVPNNVRKL